MKIGSYVKYRPNDLTRQDLGGDYLRVFDTDATGEIVAATECINAAWAWEPGSQYFSWWVRFDGVTMPLQVATRFLEQLPI
jgi:hypothetical protein